MPDLARFPAEAGGHLYIEHRETQPFSEGPELGYQAGGRAHGEIGEGQGCRAIAAMKPVFVGRHRLLVAGLCNP